MTRIWKPPDRLDRSRPRHVRLTGAGFALLVLSIVFFAGAVTVSAALLNVAGRDAEEHRLLAEEGNDAEAVVTRLWRRSGESRTPFAAYRFSVGGRVYSGQAKSRLRVWENLKIGSLLPVRFAVRNPELNVPTGWERRQMPLWAGPSLGVALLLTGLLVTLSIRNQRRLLAEGRVSRGIVTRHSMSGKETSIRFEFRLLNGATMKGCSGSSKSPAPVGSPVCVLYDPENPRRHALYPLSLTKLC